MSAVKCRVFNVLAAVSLLLCVATVLLWVRSQFAYDLVFRNIRDGAAGDLRMLDARCSQGLAELTVTTIHSPNGYRTNIAPLGRAQWGHSSTAVPIRDGPTWYWFYHPVRSTFLLAPGVTGWSEQWSVGCRLWPVAVVLAVAPLVRMLWHRSFEPGRCPTCGYDMRATPERCPECGTVVAPVA
jgi:hypothetical protein